MRESHVNDVGTETYHKLLLTFQRLIIKRIISSDWGWRWVTKTVDQGELSQERAWVHRVLTDLHKGPCRALAGDLSVVFLISVFQCCNPVLCSWKHSDLSSLIITVSAFLKAGIHIRWAYILLRKKLAKGIALWIFM